MSDFMNEDGMVQTCVDRDTLVLLHLYGILCWDKVHTECVIDDYREGSNTQTGIEVKSKGMIR